jgi:cytochrome P450
LDYSLGFSRDLVRQSVEKNDGMDVMSVLLRANASEDPANKLTDDEVMHQIRCVRYPVTIILPFTYSLPECSVILLAGHDTIATTLTWFLWEIASHPESQERIRAEIKAFRAQKGEEQPSVMDLDNMAYTQAALKVLPRRTMQATFRSH